ncbi:hypothetical protein W97_01532 [Coniosporium apollinis CBS 100218]|uniref:Uncharacterized protein n=1 Tax=Coniosporium apollinis (strain CBS 100218) TaxID=1168221 RepID=R7YKZ4_CONA1|nr:uncharacterized protein W97_01532 [Coniosporium apollinis CBS 100218]EON62311.1 hypothetical protein W97_01532 [Coniosporium apollinis CBS 100218]
MSNQEVSISDIGLKALALIKAGSAVQVEQKAEDNTLHNDQPVKSHYKPSDMAALKPDFQEDAKVALKVLVNGRMATKKNLFVYKATFKSNKWMYQLAEKQDGSYVLYDNGREFEKTRLIHG